MKRKRSKTNLRSGIAFIAALIFLAIFSALSVGMLGLSTGNAQVARNHQLGNGAFCSAQSGFEIVRYLCEGISVQGTNPSTKLSSIYNGIQTKIASSGLTCINAGLDSNQKTITIANVSLAAGQKSFNFQMTQDGSDDSIMHTRITGSDGAIERNIRINFKLDESANTVFDYGIASKGPLLMSGQTAVAGVNLAIESDVFIDTTTLGDSFGISGQASIAGDVHIVNPYASYSIGTKSVVGGETGAAAADNVHVNADPVDFPTPNVEYFRTFATGPVIDSTNLNDYSTLDNAVIAANTNPTFASDMQINGVLFIEQPNKVTFAGKSSVCGVIVGVSEVGDTSGINSIQFSGQVTSQDTSTLEGEQFANIKNETGTFLMAPGYIADFTGQANVINGVIAVSGVRFTGQAGGTINGSIINYGNSDVVLQGQSELLFNRSGTTENPAGFVPVKRLTLDKDSYSEV